MCKVLALSALLANSNAKASAIASAIVSAAISSPFSTATDSTVPTHGGGTAESLKPKVDPQIPPKLIL